MMLASYQATIDYLYSQLPMFSRMGAAAYKKDLTNTIELCKICNNPQHQFKSIHIAGTNGKGSTSHMLAAVLQQQGYKVGLYTSPHLKDFRERIKVNGEMIPEDEVILFTNKMIESIDSIQPSFFELTVVMAFAFFATQKVDIAVIETGLGGRLDSTNVIAPLVSIITNIGFDHQNLLGNTLEAIAFEKAGIIKENTPVIIGEKMNETKSVFLKKALEMNSSIHFAEEEVTIHTIETNIGMLQCEYSIHPNPITQRVTLGLHGLYQIKNLRSVILALALLKQKGFAVSQTAIQIGLQNVVALTGLYGRWQLLQKNPIVIADVAHNVDGVRKMLENINSLYVNNPSLKKLHIVIGMVKDKDIDAVLTLLPQQAIYYFTQAAIPRALPYRSLMEKAAAFELKGTCFENVNRALENALLAATQSDIILVCGSVFLVGELSYYQ